MGGLTSKTLKLQRGEKTDAEPVEEKTVPTPVPGVQYRDKQYQLSRETKSAYYYGHKNGVAEGIDQSDTTTSTVQKRVVLQSAGSSDHTLFRRVKETPTAIYFEPNDDIEEEPDDGQKKEKKNIVLENAPAVERRIKVIRDGSSDIVIRPESVTYQKHDMIINNTAKPKPRDNILNTYSVMVKNKEIHDFPNATVTLDDDKGLASIDESKERESVIVEEAEKDSTVLTSDKKEQSKTECSVKEELDTTAEHKELKDDSGDTEKDTAAKETNKEDKTMETTEQLNTVRDNLEKSEADHVARSDVSSIAKPNIDKDKNTNEGDSKESKNDTFTTVSVKTENMGLDEHSVQEIHGQSSNKAEEINKKT